MKNNKNSLVIVPKKVRYIIGEISSIPALDFVIGNTSIGDFIQVKTLLEYPLHKFNYYSVTTYGEYISKSEIGEADVTYIKCKIDAEINSFNLGDYMDKGDTESDYNKSYFRYNNIKNNDSDVTLVAGSNLKSLFLSDTDVASLVASDGNGNLLINKCENSVTANIGSESSMYANGKFSAIANSGENTNIFTNCIGSVSASSGYGGSSFSNGSYSVSASSGGKCYNSCTSPNSISACVGTASIATTANTNSVSVTVGKYGISKVSGDNSVAVALGKDGRVSGIIGTWLVLADHDDNGNIVEIHTMKVDGEIIKSNTEYYYKEGRLIESNYGK